LSISEKRKNKLYRIRLILSNLNFAIYFIDKSLSELSFETLKSGHIFMQATIVELTRYVLTPYPLNQHSLATNI
jgi:hypothetical protein